MEEISAGVVETKVWIDQQEVVKGVANVKRVEVEVQSSRGWIQTSKELEWSVWVSWRNPRTCILRSPVSLQRPEVGLTKLNKVLFGHMLTYDLNLKAS
jgi:hypothetical protein